MIVYEKEIDSSFQAVHETAVEVEKMLLSLGTWLDSSMRFTTIFILRELLNNAVEHGNHFDPQKKVFLSIIHKDYRLILKVRDEGEGIDLPENNYDTEDQDILLRTRNRGYQILTQLATELTVNDNQIEVILDFDQEEQNDDKNLRRK